MKNISAFRFDRSFAITAATLAEVLKKSAFLEIGATQLKSLGFVDPLYHDNEATPVSERHFVRQCGEALVFALRIDAKKAPAAIVKQEIKKRSAAIEEETGKKPGGKRKKEMKDEIVQDLLPKCFPTTSEIQAYIDVKNNLLIVGSSGTKAAEEIASLLRKEFVEMKPTFLALEQNPAVLLTSWVKEGEAPAGFTVDMDGEMKHSAGGVIKIAKQSMTAAEIQSHLATGYEVKKLALTWKDEISFMATQDFGISKLDWLKSKEDGKAEDKESEFAAQMALESADIAKLVNDLALAYGGEKTPF